MYPLCTAALESPSFPRKTELVGGWRRVEGLRRGRGESRGAGTTQTTASQPQRCCFTPPVRGAGPPSSAVGAGQPGDHVHALQGALQHHQAPETPLPSLWLRESPCPPSLPSLLACSRGCRGRSAPLLRLVPLFSGSGLLLPLSSSRSCPCDPPALSQSHQCPCLVVVGGVRSLL